MADPPTSGAPGSVRLAPRIGRASFRRLVVTLLLLGIGTGHGIHSQTAGVSHLARGDVNGDGALTVADACLVLRASVGLVRLTMEQAQAADIDREGHVNALDAAILLRKIVGKPAEAFVTALDRVSRLPKSPPFVAVPSLVPLPSPPGEPTLSPPPEPPEDVPIVPGLPD